MQIIPTNRKCRVCGGMIVQDLSKAVDMSNGKIPLANDQIIAASVTTDLGHRCQECGIVYRFGPRVGSTHAISHAPPGMIERHKEESRDAEVREHGGLGDMVR